MEQLPDWLDAFEMTKAKTIFLAPGDAQSSRMQDKFQEITVTPKECWWCQGLQKNINHILFKLWVSEADFFSPNHHVIHAWQLLLPHSIQALILGILFWQHCTSDTKMKKLRKDAHVQLPDWHYQLHPVDNICGCLTVCSECVFEPAFSRLFSASGPPELKPE